MSQTIAIVEDDPDQQQNYCEYLERACYRTVAFSNVPDALHGIADANPDLVVLDVILGDRRNGGFEVCRALLDQRPETPVIFLTDLTDEVDHLFGLELGAWDYLTKPISLKLLEARIANTLRISQAQDDPPAVTRIGNLALDRGRAWAGWKTETVKLTGTEFTILTTLVDAGPQGASYEELANNKIVTDNAINSHVAHMRKKFKDVDPGFDAIENISGRGYLWTDT